MSSSSPTSLRGFSSSSNFPSPSRRWNAPVTDIANWSEISHVRVEIGVQASARACGQGDPAAVLVARLARDDVDGATDGIAPVQGALRPAQHFDALDVCEAPVLAHLPAEVDAVHVYADARVGRNQVVLQADAADEGVGRRRMSSREAGDIQVRNELADVRQVRDALSFDGFCRKRADRHGDVIDALLALLRGHDHRLERGLLCMSGSSCQQGAKRRGYCQRKFAFVHCETPLSEVECCDHSGCRSQWLIPPDVLIPDARVFANVSWPTSRCNRPNAGPPRESRCPSASRCRLRN